MRDLRQLTWAVVCLGFTGGGVAWADAAQGPLRGSDIEQVSDKPRLDPLPASKHWIDSPYAPHRTAGSIVRIGTIVGEVQNERFSVTGLGILVSAGRRFGRLSVESEYQYLGYQDHSPLSSEKLGHGHRLGLVGRFEVLRLDSHAVGPNTQLSVYVEGGAGVAWHSWYRPGRRDESPWAPTERVVPIDSKRVEGVVGVGFNIDHRLQEPHGLKRIGWMIGVRATAAPHEQDRAVVCRSTTTVCRTAPMMPDENYVDRSLLMSTSFGATF